MWKHGSQTFLLAGFGSFPGAPVNPAELMVRDFQGPRGGCGPHVRRLIVPVEWDRSWRVLQVEIQRCRPVAVLLFGLHAKAQRFRIETKAFNERLTDRPDAAGRCADSTVIADGPFCLDAHLPLPAIERRLAETGIDFETSNDAGRYLCNETLFQLCRSASALGVRHYGFVHTPYTDAVQERPAQTGAVVSAADLARLAEIALECLADATQDAEAGTKSPAVDR